MDFSGKKPLDYQKQMTSVSESTYSSKYRMSIDWPSTSDNDSSSPSSSPFAHFGSMAKRRDRKSRRSIISITAQPVGVQRTYSVRTNGDKPIKGEGVYYYADNDNGGGSMRLRRKDKRQQSFLRKTFGPSTSGNPFK
jgi:hypothetical protein